MAVKYTFFSDGLTGSPGLFPRVEPVGVPFVGRRKLTRDSLAEVQTIVIVLHITMAKIGD
jgi:hypothetical protein